MAGKTEKLGNSGVRKREGITPGGRPYSTTKYSKPGEPKRQVTQVVAGKDTLYNKGTNKAAKTSTMYGNTNFKEKGSSKKDRYSPIKKGPTRPMPKGKK